MRDSDLPEEHRKYLKVPSNPRVSNASIFAMLSDNSVSLARLEEKHNGTAVRVKEMGTKLDKVTDKFDSRLGSLESDFTGCRESKTGRLAEIGERFKWQEKTQKAIIALLTFVIGLILTLQFGIGFPIP